MICSMARSVMVPVWRPAAARSTPRPAPCKSSSGPQPTLASRLSRRAAITCSRTPPGSAPPAIAASKAAMALRGSRAIRQATSSPTFSSRPVPMIAWTSSALIGPEAAPSSCSKSDWLSRMLPAARRAISVRASAVTSAPSASTICARRRAIAGASTVWKSNRWQRERIVIGSLSGSVVQSTNFTWDGGSSSVLSNALKASRVSMWTSSMM